MESHDKDRLDEWLDGALQRYGALEPRAGLEDRILANLAVQERSARRRGWDWRFLNAGAAAASLVILLMIGWHMRQKGIVKPPAKAPTVANKSPAGQQSATRSHAVAAAVSRQARKRPQPLNAGVRPEPKLDQFPSQRPLSEQEQLLAEYVTQFPNEAKLIAQQEAETEREMEQLYTENSQRRSRQER
jgi:hypothetical protein